MTTSITTIFMIFLSLEIMMKVGSCLVFVLLALLTFVECDKKPNIIFILADDYGFNDIGYHAINHGSDMKTPFLDSLAMGGVRLENYYVQPICTPSRSQLMSGRYQIHTGLQHATIRSPQPNGVPLDNILLPEQLKNCGYNTHMVGKWHIGFFKDGYLPWNRGFDSYFGYLAGHEDYYKKYHCWAGMCGYDMNSENGPTNETYGEYSLNVYTEKVHKIIDKQNSSSKPFFLYLALQSVHAPMQAPKSYVEPFSYIKDSTRRIYAGMVASMDEAVKNITDHLKTAGIWDNTLLIFSTDNGGQTVTGGNNWPLRGRKATLWEGGIRGVGFVHGKMLNVPNPNPIVNTELIHISDWYPTLLSVGQCPLKPGTQSLDGYDQWKTIKSYSKTPRKELLINIDPLWDGSHAYNKPEKITFDVRSGFDTSTNAAIRRGDWKLLTGGQGFDDWIKPPEMKNLYVKSKVVGDVSEDVDPGVQKFKPKIVQLFNIKNDPYERIEVSAVYPHIVDKLLARLAKYNSTAVTARFPPDDKNADPKGGFWKPWMN